jgi:hypothetical protein
MHVPIYICTNWGPANFKKMASVFFAHALARSVLPVPGGPYRRTPFGALIPMARIQNMYHKNDLKCVIS